MFPKFSIVSAADLPHVTPLIRPWQVLALSVTVFSPFLPSFPGVRDRGSRQGLPASPGEETGLVPRIPASPAATVTGRAGTSVFLTRTQVLPTF